jgi:hypothetical protein
MSSDHTLLLSPPTYHPLPLISPFYVYVHFFFL